MILNFCAPIVVLSFVFNLNFPIIRNNHYYTYYTDENNIATINLAFATLLLFADNSIFCTYGMIFA